MLLVDEYVDGIELHRRGGHTHQHRGTAVADAEVAAAAGGYDLLHGLTQADTVKRKVGARHVLFEDGELSFPFGHFVHGLDGVHLGRIDAVGGAEGLGELELGVIQINGDDGIGAGHLGANHGRQADASNPEDHDALARLHVGGVDHGAGAGHHRTADDGGHVPADARIDLHHVLLVADRVIGPGENVF